MATARGRGAVKARAAPTPTSRQVLYLPLALTLGLLVLSLLPRVQGNLRLAWSFWGTAGALLIWQTVLFLRLRSASVGRSLQSVLRPQHYVQAMVQIAVFAFWGWYWRPVYDFALLLTAQLVFAYVFDMLLAWSRRETYVLGFGPFPIILSINLFLWFRDDWFYLQFLMIGVGFLGKELVRWRRGGRNVHIFNPSAFALGLFSLVLITTGTTDLTWGQEIASTLTLAPLIYLYLFLLGLIVMYFFSITLVACSAAVVLFGLSALYASLTGGPLLPRLRHPRRGLPRPPSPDNRPVHVAADITWETPLRSFVRSGCIRPLHGPGSRRSTDVLRQASGRPASEPERSRDRQFG